MTINARNDGYSIQQGDNTVREAIPVVNVWNVSYKTADGAVKSSAGFIHTITIAPLTATPTAGKITVYNNTAESGTVVYGEWVFATDVGHTVVLDAYCDTGIYVGFDGTAANIGVTVTYR